MSRQLSRAFLQGRSLVRVHRLGTFCLLLAAALALCWAFPGTASAGCLGEGFKQAKWGMTLKELQEKIPGIREDFNRFEPNVTAYHSFEFPNNGFSEFRLFRGKLFYIRVKITSADFNNQLLQSMKRCGEPISHDGKGGAERYLWTDDNTALSVYLYPYYGEIRAKSQAVAKEWLTYRKKEDDIEEFLQEQIQSAFTSDELTIQERERLRNLKKTLQDDEKERGSVIPGAAKPAQPASQEQGIGNTETWGRGTQDSGASTTPRPAPTAPPNQTTPQPPAQSGEQKPAQGFEGMEDFLQ